MCQKARDAVHKYPFLVVRDDATETTYPDPLVGEVPYSKPKETPAPMPQSLPMPTPQPLSFTPAVAAPPPQPLSFTVAAPPPQLQEAIQSHPSFNSHFPLAVAMPLPQPPLQQPPTPSANSLFPAYPPIGGGPAMAANGLEDYGAADPPAATATGGTGAAGLSKYELERQETMRKNQEVLDALNIQPLNGQAEQQVQKKRVRTQKPADDSRVSRARRSADQNSGARSGLRSVWSVQSVRSAGIPWGQTPQPPSRHPPSPPSPPTAGNRPDYTEEATFTVSHISAHRGTKRRSFLVHWEGHPDADATWEPEGHLTNNEALHKYLATIVTTDAPVQEVEKPQAKEHQQVC